MYNMKTFSKWNAEESIFEWKGSLLDNLEYKEYVAFEMPSVAQDALLAANETSHSQEGHKQINKFCDFFKKK